MCNETQPINKGKYFVTSSGDEPNTVRFTLEEAMLVDDDYIDVFDEFGNKVDAYMRVGDNQYTTEF